MVCSLFPRSDASTIDSIFSRPCHGHRFSPAKLVIPSSHSGPLTDPPSKTSTFVYLPFANLPSRYPFQPKIEIYGPSGIRTFIRQIMKMTNTSTADTYTVHELLTLQDPLTQCCASNASIDDSFEHHWVMHSSELPGQDIRCSPDDGFWRSLAHSRGVFGEVFVDAGPILHRGLRVISRTRECDC